MIKIDGSYGEGGGQIVRTATSLSAYTGKPIRIEKIRSGRSNPGLRPQHVKGIETLRELCGAKTGGVEVESQSIVFKPNDIRSSDLEIDIGTAGSISLLLQSLLVPLMKCENEVSVEIKGGTDVKWSPPIDYIKHVLMPILNNHGYRASVEVKKRGFYPKGGGKVVFHFFDADMKRFDLSKRGDILSIGGVSCASNHLKHANVAERQAKAAEKVLGEKLNKIPRIKKEYSNSRCPGSVAQIWLKTQNSIIGANALGEKNKSSEDVGKEAAKDLMKNLNGTIDRYAGDQLLPFLAISGGKIKPSKITGHCKTNQKIIQKFLNVSFKTKKGIIKART